MLSVAKSTLLQVVVSLVVVVVAVHTVSGFSRGAPLQACVTLTPQHGAAQNTPSPHIVDLSDFDSMFNESLNTTTLYYTPNTMYSSMYNYHIRMDQLYNIII